MKKFTSAANDALRSLAAAHAARTNAAIAATQGGQP